MGNDLRVAVIGAGVTGLSAAWLLGRRFDVTLFEAEARLGGHANTVDVDARRGAADRYRLHRLQHGELSEPDRAV